MSPQFTHFTHITGNVKERYDLALGKLTCITGDEASYKTAIADGIVLALTGAHHIGKNPSDLIQLAADPLVGIQVTLQGASGTAHWRLNINPETGKAMRPNPPVFEGALASLSDDERYCIIPTLAVRDLLRGAKSEKKVREAVLRRFGGDIKNMPEPFALRPEQEERWREEVEFMKEDLGENATADMILAGLSEFFRNESMSLSRAINPMQARINAQKAQVQAQMVGAERLPELEKKLDLALKWEGSARARLGVHETTANIEALQKQLDEAKLALVAAQETERQQTEGTKAHLDEVKARKDRLWAEWVEMARKLSNAETNASVYTKVINNGGCGCPYCASDVGLDRLTKTRDEFLARAESRSAEARRLEEEVKKATDEYEDALHGQAGVAIASSKEVTSRRADVTALENTIRTKQGHLVGYQKELEGVPTSYNGPVASELRSEIVVIQEARQSKAQLLEEVAKLQEMEDERDLLKTLEKEAIELQRQVMSTVAKTASDEVSRCMTDGRRAVFDPESSEWSVIGCDGQPHTLGAACGTEETALMLGFAAAWTRGAPIRVAVFDDKDLIGLSRKGIADFFTACEEAANRGDFTQVIIVFNRPEEVPSNWHKIIRTAVTRPVT